MKGCSIPLFGLAAFFAFGSFTVAKGGFQFLTGIGLAVLMAYLGVVIIKGADNTSDPESGRGKYYSKHYHFLSRDRFDNLGMTHQGASSYEGWDKDTPKSMWDAAERMVNIDPLRFYDDAVVIKSYVDNSSGKPVIHDGVVQICSLEELRSGNVTTSIASQIMLSVNEVDSWRVRK